MACTPLAQRLQDAFVAAERERQGDCFFAGERAADEILDDLT